jgi:TolB-like protein/Flp pilus assembly protein TadD
MPNSDQHSKAESSADRLDSWKEIAAYLRRQVRTVNLWEKTEALPVHRHLHSKRGTVYAYKSELEVWLQQRGLLRSTTAPKSRQSRIMLAVLPFVDLSGDASEDYFSNGLTDEMISQLGRVNPTRLGVIARTSSMHYKHSEKSISAIGGELEVEYILEGSVRRLGTRVRITAQLISVEGQLNIWSESYDREVADIVFLQIEVASRIAQSIVAELNPPAISTSTGNATSNEAYLAYLKGRNCWNLRTEESLLRAVHYFGQAVIKDPTLAIAHCGLADAYDLLAVYGVLPAEEAMRLAKTAALHALEIDPQSGEAHACLADVVAFYDWDWDAARQEYRRSLALNPSYATAHHYYAYFLAILGQHAAALAEIELAHVYDPHSTIISVWKGIILRLAGNYEDAIDACFEVTGKDPRYVLARWALGLAYEAAGEMKLALTEFETAAGLSGSNPSILASLAHNHAIQGNTEHAAEILKDLHALSAYRHVEAYDLAIVYTGLRDEEQALNYLDRAFHERSSWVATLPMEPRVHCLRNNVFFHTLIKRLRLPSDSALASR